MDRASKIVFPGNPWPNGHAIAGFTWSGHIEEDDQLRFYFELESERYYAQSEGDEGDSDWSSPGVWGNYHQCIIRPNRGFVVASEREPLKLSELPGRTFVADETTPATAYDDLAFHIYLLGHDSVGRHQIRFEASDVAGCVSIHWTGAIALTYAGREEFEHEFRATVLDVPLLSKVSVDSALELDWAHRLLLSVLDDDRPWEIRGKKLVAV